MIADNLQIDENALARELKKVKSVQTVSTGNSERIVKKNVSIVEKAQKNLLSVFLVNDNQLSIEQINQIIGDTPFTDETLINVKSTIDKLTYTVNNVKELVEKLYTTFANDSETQKVITDLISISETFQNLSNEDFITVIKENVNKINQCNKEKEQEKIRNLYKSANDDEIEALKIQMQLRDKINNRLKLEKMNE